jgi:regulatory protein
VEALRAQGLVDDAEFARHYARTRIARKRLGPARLQADLRRLGVDERTAAEAVQDTLARERIEPRELLREAAARKLRELSGLERAVQRRRLRAFLARRGFGAGEIVEALRDLLG